MIVMTAIYRNQLANKTNKEKKSYTEIVNQAMR
jgi:hypothetical protein